MSALVDDRTARVGLRARNLWSGVSAWGRVSAVGLLGAAVLAFGLAWFIPRQVWEHVLASEIETDRKVITGLLSADELTGAPDGVLDIERLDRIVREAVLTGDYVRAKLWAADGTVVYSDDARLIGQRFEIEDHLAEALAGTAVSERTTLDEDENLFERSLAEDLLETYIPVEIAGTTYAWEVYRSLDQLEASLAEVRRSVWLSVGAGLAVLVVFLVSWGGALVGLAERRRSEADRRSREMATLLTVANAVHAEATTPGEVSRAAVDALVATGEFRSAALHVAGAPVPAASAGVATPVGVATTSVPVGEADGVTLVVDAASDGQEEGRRAALLAGVAHEIGSALARGRLYEDLVRARETQRRLTGELVSAHEQEHRAVVGEIHDGIGQDLHRILFGLRGCRSGVDGPIDDELAELERIAEVSVRQLRATLRSLHPPALETIGLVAALRSLADRTEAADGTRVLLEVEDVDPLPSDVRIAAFRIVQEGLRNVTRHAGTDEATVVLERRGDHLHLEVVDGGRGMGQASHGLGLWLLEQRAEALGGRLELLDAGPGTRLVATLPERGRP